jgi:hypothetical protein
MERIGLKIMRGFSTALSLLSILIRPPNLADFLYEPFYQLVRQSLLAAQILEMGKPEIGRVQEVHLTLPKTGTCWPLPPLASAGTGIPPIRSGTSS